MGLGRREIAKTPCHATKGESHKMMTPKHWGFLFCPDAVEFTVTQSMALAYLFLRVISVFRIELRKTGVM